MRRLLAGFAPLLAAAAALAAEPAPAPAPMPMDVPVFREQALAAGVDHRYTGPWEFFVGGGVAAVDCNGDGKPDLVIAGGKNPMELYLNRSPVGGPLRFEKQAIDIDPKLLVDVTGVYPIDIDGDGQPDLVVLRVGGNLLLKGSANCHFEVANKAWGFDGGRAWTTAFAATWERGQKYPTLAFGNYVDRSAPGSPWGTCQENVLLRPHENPAGLPDYSERAALEPGYCALSMLFTDWNRSGEAALRIANDRQYYRGGEEQMWRVEPGKLPRLYSRADGWRSVHLWGMGLAQTDLDGTGRPGYVITSMGDTKLEVLDTDADADQPIYKDLAFDRGATAHRPYAGGDQKPSTGWHPAFEDVNNDGLIDLFITKGNVEAMPDFASLDPDNLLLGGWDNKFHEAGAQAGLVGATPLKGRGAAVVDLDLDGNLDLVVVNREGPVTIFRNEGARRADGGVQPLGNWLEVKLVDPDNPNHAAIGARVTAKYGTRTVSRDLLVGGGHASGKWGWCHFGVGTAERAEVRVQWPDGSWSHPYRVFANQFVVIERGKAIADYWYPAD
jgi:hypothetical protein